MVPILASRLITLIVTLIGPAVLVFMTPTVSEDPINQSKMLLISIAASTILGISVANFKIVRNFQNKLYLMLIILFIFQLTLVLFIAPGPFNQQFFGTFGRNTGFISYLGLALVSLGAATVSSRNMLTKIATGLIIAGIFSWIYSVVQTLGLDPVKWNNPYSPIVGFLGNPNFQSSFLGMFGASSAALALQKNQTVLKKIILLFSILSTLGLIVRSNSQQGIIVLGIGIAIVLFLYLFYRDGKNHKVILFGYSITVSIIGLIVILGTLNLGPLGQFLYKLSVRQRGYYWNAAIEMIKDKPITGVGLDSYGDWYFGFRSVGAAQNTPTVTSNSAHNVFLDFGANGGLPLLFIYLALIAITAVTIIKLLPKFAEFNWGFAALVAVWLGYLAQSVISINQLGLAIWCWLIMGIFIGLEADLSKEKLLGEPPGNKNAKFVGKNQKSNTNSSTTYIFASVFLIIGFVVVFPVFQNDANSRKAIGSRSADQLISTVLKQPQDTYRIVGAATILANSNLLPQSRDLVDHAIAINPRMYNAWELKLQLTDPKSLDYQSIKDKLNELNPRVPRK